MYTKTVCALCCTSHILLQYMFYSQSHTCERYTDTKSLHIHMLHFLVSYSFTLWFNCLLCTDEGLKPSTTYKIKHHYEQETDKILRTNKCCDRWDVLPSPSTYITRPRWIYSRRSRIQKSISVQAAKLVGFCDYFLHSHALERYTDRVKIVNLLPALHPLGKRIDSVPCVPLFIYHIILILVILLRFLLFLYICILFTVVFSVI